MGKSAEELRREIDETRGELGTTVDAISDHVSPSRIMERRKDRLVDRWTSAKQTVMGSASGLHDSVASATDSVGRAPQGITSQTQGQPIVAGVIAFGVGFLAASVFPGSRAEAQLAQKVQAAAQPVVDELKQSGQDVAAALKEPALESVQQVKETALSGATEVQGSAQGMAGDLKSTFADASDQMSSQVGDSVENLRNQ
jgi:hypothetical protein